MIDLRRSKKNKARLLKEKQKLETLLLRIAKRDPTNLGDFHVKYPEFGSKDDENAAEVTVFETNLAEEWDLEQKLRRVEAALKRIADGTYGICKRGGEALSEARLLAVPEAENCVKHDRG